MSRSAVSNTGSNEDAPEQIRKHKLKKIAAIFRNSFEDEFIFSDTFEYDYVTKTYSNSDRKYRKILKEYKTYGSDR